MARSGNLPREPEDRLPPDSDACSRDEPPDLVCSNAGLRWISSPDLAFTITGACVVGTQVIGRIKQVLRRIGRLETSGDCAITIHPHERFLAQLARQTA